MDIGTTGKLNDSNLFVRLDHFLKYTELGKPGRLTFRVPVLNVADIIP